MGPGRALGRAVQRGDAPPPDCSPAGECRVEAADAPCEEASLICKGCGPRKFAEQAASHIPLHGGPRGSTAILVMYGSVGRTCGHVEPLVKECHGVDCAEGTVSESYGYGGGAPIAEFHAGDGRSRTGLAGGASVLARHELALRHMSKSAQREHTAESLRVGGLGGSFFGRIPGAEFAGAECAPADSEIRAALSVHASFAGPAKSGQCRAAGAAKAV